MTWRCPNIESGIVFYDNGVIRPCGVINWSYSKPVSETSNPDRFLDLYEKDGPPAECLNCTELENANLSSRRSGALFIENGRINKKVKFLDFRNSNLCNAKCRFCGPQHSNKWSIELYNKNNLRHTDVSEYFDDIFTEDLIEIYFAGGEPLINEEHYRILNLLIDKGLSSNIKLQYSTNLSVLNFKGQDQLIR